MAIFKTIQMNISIKMDPETLFLLHKVMLEESQMRANDRARRAGKSIRMELFATISKRCITYSNNQNGKTISISFKYYQADLICKILDDMKYVFGVFEANKLDMLRNQLHQKLV